jgi:hypothetical protein
MSHLSEGRELVSYSEVNRRKFSILKSQIVISSWDGLRRARPYAFTEQGVATLSSVPWSKGAIQVNIEIMRAFVGLRQILASNKELAKRFHSFYRSDLLSIAIIMVFPQVALLLPNMIE